MVNTAKYLLRIHDRSDSNSQRLSRNFTHVAVKELGIGLDRLDGQCFYTCSGDEAGSGFVERYVTIRTNTLTCHTRT